MKIIHLLRVCVVALMMSSGVVFSQYLSRTKVAPITFVITETKSGYVCQELRLGVLSSAGPASDTLWNAVRRFVESREQERLKVLMRSPIIANETR